MLEALEDNVSKSKGGKQKMIELCIAKLKEKKCMTQYIILLCSLLDSLEHKATIGIFSSSEFDKILDKLYNGNLATIVFEEFVETSKRLSPEDLTTFNEDRVFNSRIQLFILLVFKGKQKPDAVVSFRKFVAHLLSDAENQANLERFISIMTSKDLSIYDNTEVFFNSMNDMDMIENPQINGNIYGLYEDVFIKCNIKSGALEHSTSKKNIIHIVKQEKFAFLKQLWIFCLKRQLKEGVKDSFYRLLVECYFRSNRKYEAVEAQKAWTYFTNDVADELTSIRSIGDPQARSILLGNLAGIWIKTIEISSGSLYIGSASGSAGSINVAVVGFE